MHGHAYFISVYLTLKQDRFMNKYNNVHLNAKPLLIKIPDKTPNPDT